MKFLTNTKSLRFSVRMKV